MRTLKFRIYDKTEKRMKFLDSIWNMPDPSYDFDEIQQFTGLVDRLGKEIYEGDILREQPSGFEPRDIYIAEWTDNRWGLVKKHKDFGNYERHFKDAFQMEVIGNIYENGDLLK
jgi:uncharacterized phage protein (TIGR01671 family)